MTVVKEHFSDDRTQKVQITRNNDGTYGFQWLRYSTDPRELCWVPFGRPSYCLAPDQATAEREARGRVPWLAARDTSA